MNKIDRRIVKTKEGIRKAFLQLIQSKEFHLITVTELANLANIDRKTFYLHYNSTADILKEFEAELAGKVLMLLKKNQTFDMNSFFQGLNKIMMEDIGLYRRISETTSYAFLQTECKDILKNTIKESFYTKSGMSAEKFNVYAEYIASGIVGIYTNWLSSISEMSLEELTDTAKDAIANGWSRIIIITLLYNPMGHRNRFLILLGYSLLIVLLSLGQCTRMVIITAFLLLIDAFRKLPGESHF